MHEPQTQSEGEALAPSTRTYWRLAGLSRSLLYSVPLGFYGLTKTLEQSPWGGALLGTAALVLLLGSGWALLATGLRYRRFRFARTEAALWIRSGVLIRREQTIPLARIQHLDVGNGPLERLFGIAHLSVFTAGGRGASARIPGLTPERASALRSELLAASAALGLQTEEA